MATDPKVKTSAGEAPQLNDQFADVKRVAEPVRDPGPRTKEGELIKRDEYGRAYTESTPQTGGIRNYLSEEEYPPELEDAEGNEIAPPPLPPIIPPQAAATAASQFDPVPEKDARSGLQTSAERQPTIAPVTGSAPASSAPTFSTNEAAAAEAKKAAQPAATQAVIDATLAHAASQPKGGPK